MDTFATITPAHYVRMRDYLLSLGTPYADDFHWAQSISSPTSAGELVGQYQWVVLCSGMKVDIARKIERRIDDALRQGKSVSSAFGHRGKAAAIQRSLDEREQWYTEFKTIASVDRLGLIEWCDSRPWIGPVTRYHLAKNLGVDTPKPDRHIARLSNLPEYPATDIETLYRAALELCEPLAAATAERLATVDLVLWWLCARGWLRRDGDTLVFAPTALEH